LEVDNGEDIGNQVNKRDDASIEAELHKSDKNHSAPDTQGL